MCRNGWTSPGGGTNDFNPSKLSARYVNLCLSNLVLQCGRRLSEGDIVGCGWHPEKTTIYFTLNGEHLGQCASSASIFDAEVSTSAAFLDIVPEPLYPVVGFGLGSTDVHIKANFGRLPFRARPYVDRQLFLHTFRQNRQNDQLKQRQPSKPDWPRKEPSDVVAREIPHWS